MTNNPSWLFNEKKSAGVDYQSSEIAREYDNRQGFRDFSREAEEIVKALGLSSDATILDIGCGTGALSTHLAKKCRHVYAVDVSGAMIACLEKKIADEAIENITTATAGFLEYEHRGATPDAIICTVALHHLPDFWKQIALYNFHNILGDGGKLFLTDVVFGFSPDEYRREIDEWLTTMRTMAGTAMSDEMLTHIRDEYSTWDWVLSGMLEKAGFSIVMNQEIMKHTRVYICAKTKHPG